VLKEIGWFSILSALVSLGLVCWAIIRFIQHIKMHGWKILLDSPLFMFLVSSIPSILILILGVGIVILVKGLLGLPSPFDVIGISGLIFVIITLHFLGSTNLE
jgi:hypothetical protein